MNDAKSFCINIETGCGGRSSQFVAFKFTVGPEGSITTASTSYVLQRLGNNSTATLCRKMLMLITNASILVSTLSQVS